MIMKGTNKVEEPIENDIHGVSMIILSPNDYIEFQKTYNVEEGWQSLFVKDCGALEVSTECLHIVSKMSDQDKTIIRDKINISLKQMIQDLSGSKIA